MCVDDGRHHIPRRRGVAGRIRPIQMLRTPTLSRWRPAHATWRPQRRDSTPWLAVRWRVNGRQRRLVYLCHGTRAGERCDAGRTSRPFGVGLAPSACFTVAMAGLPQGPLIVACLLRTRSSRTCDRPQQKTCIADFKTNHPSGCSHR